MYTNAPTLEALDDPLRELIRPSPSQWQSFLIKLDRLGVWNWREHYELPVCDGTPFCSELTVKFEIDPIKIKTNERLAGVKSLLRLLEDAIPEYEEREQTALRELAQNDSFEAAEYFMYQSGLEHEFRFWLPRFAAYSVVTLLYTTLEVQLHECAKRAQQRMKLCFGPDDIKDRGIEAAATYLTKSGVYDIKHDEAWPTLIDLRKLRNLIVHRAGTRGRIEEHQKTADRLAKNYEGHLKYPRDDKDWWNEVWISMELCRLLADKVEAFLGRALSKVNALVAREES